MGVTQGSYSLPLLPTSKLMVSGVAVALSPSVFRLPTTHPEVSNKSVNGFVQLPYRSSVSPFEASGAMMLIRGLNPTWAKEKGPVRSARNVWAFQVYLSEKDFNAASRPLLTKLTVADRRLTSSKSSNIL